MRPVRLVDLLQFRRRDANALVASTEVDRAAFRDVGAQADQGARWRKLNAVPEACN
jgi:hypothetical protein